MRSFPGFLSSTRVWSWVFACCLAAVLACTGCAKRESPFEKISESEVDPAAKEVAERAALRLFMGWKDGRFEPLTDDFDELMKQALNPRAQKAAYTEIQIAFGDFEALELGEVLRAKNKPGIKIYRFHGEFSGEGPKAEIRVTLNERNKVSGLWCFPWGTGLK